MAGEIFHILGQRPTIIQTQQDAGHHMAYLKNLTVWRTCDWRSGKHDKQITMTTQYITPMIQTLNEQHSDNGKTLFIHFHNVITAVIKSLFSSFAQGKHGVHTEQS